MSSSGLRKYAAQMLFAGLGLILGLAGMAAYQAFRPAPAQPLMVDKNQSEHLNRHIRRLTERIDQLTASRNESASGVAKQREDRTKNAAEIRALKNELSLLLAARGGSSAPAAGLSPAEREVLTRQALDMVDDAVSAGGSWTRAHARELNEKLAGKVGPQEMRRVLRKIVLAVNRGQLKPQDPLFVYPGVFVPPESALPR